MDLDSLTPVDHARRFALMLTSALGSFVLVAVWMALEWHFVVALLLGVAAGVVAFYPFKMLMRIFYPLPKYLRNPQHRQSK